MADIEVLHKEIDEIRGNVAKILFILENEGEVREEVIKALEEAKNAPEEKYIPHDDVKKLMK